MQIIFAWLPQVHIQSPFLTLMSIEIKKLGTFDPDIVEINPVVFKGKLWLMEYIRNFDKPHHRYYANQTGDSYFRFLSLEDYRTVTPSFGKGLHFCNAFVHGDKVIVTAVENWGKSRFYQMESNDLVHWTEPHVILEGEGWMGYNTSVCQVEDHFLLTFELGAPKELVGTPFTMFFAESTDLMNWKWLGPDKSLVKNIYTGGPMVRYYDGWYFFFYLANDPDPAKHYVNRVMRSRDLVNWEPGKRDVLVYDENDKLIHPKANLTPEQLQVIANAEDYNNSDLDMCEWQGKLFLTYSWGNQHGTEFLAFAEAEASERDFCFSFFE